MILTFMWLFNLLSTFFGKNINFKLNINIFSMLISHFYYILFSNSSDSRNNTFKHYKFCRLCVDICSVRYFKIFLKKILTAHIAQNCKSDIWTSYSLLFQPIVNLSFYHPSQNSSLHHSHISSCSHHVPKPNYT